jgi:hypothetical protein
MDSLGLLRAFLAFGSYYYGTLASTERGREHEGVLVRFQAALAETEGEPAPKAVDGAARLLLRLAGDLHDREMMWAFAWEIERLANAFLLSEFLTEA